MLSRITYDRDRGTVRVEPHDSRARETTELDVLDCPGDADNADQGEYIKERRIRWARLIRRVRLEDPLLCPRCGSAMRIISFITGRPVVDRILRHIGFTFSGTPAPPYRPPPRPCASPME